MSHAANARASTHPEREDRHECNVRGRHGRKGPMRRPGMLSHGNSPKVSQRNEAWFVPELGQALAEALRIRWPSLFRQANAKKTNHAWSYMRWEITVFRGAPKRPSLAEACAHRDHVAARSCEVLYVTCY